MSPRGHRSTSSSSQRERPPIEYIEINPELQETRDDETSSEPNLLISLIENRDWDGVAKHIHTPRGIDEASQKLSSCDCALHILCRCGSDLKVPKYGPIPRKESLSSSSFGSGISESESEESKPNLEPSESKEEFDSSKPEDHFPPKSVFLTVLQAFPGAVKIIGAGGSLPLHHAVRYRYPTELLRILIRAYPQALDMRDGGMRTPRDYVPIIEDIAARSAFLRPTSCWLQHLRDEKMQTRLENELVLLEGEVEGLLKEMETSRDEEAALGACLRQMEQELEAFGNLEQLREFNRKGKDIQTSLENEIDVIRGKMEGLVGQMIMKYADEEKDRAYMNSFSDDVIKIYNNVNDGMVELREDLEKIKLGSQVGQKEKRK